MKKIYKNIICIIIMILGIGTIIGTVIIANNNLTNNNQMPDMPNNNSNGVQRPSMPNGNSNNGQRPSMPNGNSSNEQDSSMPGNISNGEQPPEKPSGESNQSDGQESSNMNEPPSMPNNNEDMNNSNQMQNNNHLIAKDSVATLSIGYIIAIIIGSLLFSISLLYLILSHLGSNNIFISFDKGLIYVLLTIIATATLSFGTIYYTNNNVLLPSTANVNNINNNGSSNVTNKGKKTVNSNETLNDSYTSTDSDENAILVSDGGNATIENATIEKSGDSANTESADFYGTNAGILTTANATSTIKNTTITTNGKGANAVFATGENAKVYISDSTIKTTGESSSRGLDATYGGYIEGTKLKITTQGASSATLATDRGEGTIKVSDSTLETNGAGSPIIYSTGDISISDTKGTANSAQMVVVEGKNSATVTDSTLYASAKGNRNQDVDQAGVMIYQSMSGDAAQGKGTFTAKNSSLNILSSSSYYKTAPMFFITNTTAEINLEKTTLNYGSNILLSVKGTSEWGNSGSNGGTVTLNAKNQTLNGNIEIDNISTLTLNLNSKSKYEGTINADNTAKSIVVNLSSDSKWKLTGDTYITELNDDDSDYSNIDLNGYKLYVNGVLLKK